MEYADIFKFCPKCTKPLILQEKNLFVCSHCDFHYYINPAACNAVIIKNKRGEILLVERKGEPKKGYWDLPGGFIEVNETVEDSVIREVQEELGCQVATIKYLGSFPDRYPYKGVHYYTVGMVYSGEIGDQPLKPSDDVSGYQFFTPDSIPYEKIAFEAVKKALRMYLPLSSS